jgi:hypothetical protein
MADKSKHYEKYVKLLLLWFIISVWVYAGMKWLSFNNPSSSITPFLMVDDLK